MSYRVNNRLKCRSLPTDWSDWVKMKEYCERKYLTPGQVTRLIALRHVKAVKFRGRWWIKL